MRPELMLGSAIQDYVKTIYKLSQFEQRCTPSLIAERQGVSAAAVTKMLKRLQELGLVRYTRSQELALTEKGDQAALEIIRHHRLLEAYLLHALGYTWDAVDEEAEKLEHVISEEFEDRIDALLGYPTHDPHGDPIPTKDGTIDQTRHRTLAELRPGQAGVVRRVTDGDPAMLRYLGHMGLYPAASVQMLDQEPFGGPLRVRVAGTERTLGRELAGHVFVSVEETTGADDESRLCSTLLTSE